MNVELHECYYRWILSTYDTSAWLTKPATNTGYRG